MSNTKVTNIENTIKPFLTNFQILIILNLSQWIGILKYLYDIIFRVTNWLIRILSEFLGIKKWLVAGALIKFLLL